MDVARREGKWRETDGQARETARNCRFTFGTLGMASTIDTCSDTIEKAPYKLQQRHHFT
jgi:hypothetical protein